MSIRCGIVGLPNVGKSTLFNALTNSKIAAENFPFCTIEPNVGIVNNPDHRLEKISEIIKPKKTIYSTLEFVDIAGLVEGASKGAGKGNAFLANIRETDAIIQVVRCFDDNKIIHVNNKISPSDDVEIINTELILADLESVEKSITKQKRNVKAGDKESIILNKILEKCYNHLSEGKAIRTLNLNFEEKSAIKAFNFITLKPMLYVGNTCEDSIERNPHLIKLKKLAKLENSEFIALCNKYEAELLEMEKETKQEFLAEIGQQQTGLARFINISYKLLGVYDYFTAGKKEVRAWTIKKNSTAQQAAGVIHSDMARGFIRAEIIKYKDFMTYQSESKVREVGKIRSEGKEYIMQEADIAHFRFNV